MSKWSELNLFLSLSHARAFHILWAASVSLSLPCPSDSCSYLFISRTFSGCCISFPFQFFLSFLLFVCCCPCFSLRFVVHAGVQSQTWRLAQLVEHILCAFFRRNRGQKERRYQSASVGSHSALKCGFEVSFLSLLLLLCCRVYAVCRSTETNPEDAWGGKRALANDLPG